MSGGTQGSSRMLGAGLIVVAASYVAWFWLLARYPAGQLSAFTFLSPIFAVALGALLLSEPVTPRLLLGGLLVVAGTALAAVRRSSTGH